MMSSKLREMLISKIIPASVSKEEVIKNLKNIHVSYKHYEKTFLVSLSSVQAKNFADNNPATSSDSIINPETIQSSINKETFIKNVIYSCLNHEPTLDVAQKKLVLDFSSPNIAKPFHAGHLRSTIIGNFIANINKHFNHRVTKINYLGDWGTQFGLLQYGLRAQNIDINQLKDTPISTLYKAYVYANKIASSDEKIHIEARKYFSDIEQGNADLESWKKIREITIEELKQVYQRLRITFDAYHWESDYNGKAIQDIIQLLENKKILRIDESGKKVANVNNRDVAVLKSDNSTLYLSRDIAALLDRYQRYNFDKMLYIVDNSQTDHFAALFEIVKRVNEKCASGCEHIKFGRLKGMSTRGGNVVFLNDILDEAKSKMQKMQSQSKNTRDSARTEETCDILGTTAVIINDLKQRRQKDYKFEWERALQSEGDSGIKLQYLHCRLWSLEKNCGIPIPEDCDPNYLPEEIVGEVIAELARFESVLHKSLEEYEACILVNYLFRLARYVNRMFKELNVKNVSPDLAGQRLLVFHASRLVVKTSLELLGVKPLYEM